MLGSMYRKWAGIKTFGVFNTIRKNKKTGEETKDTQYFITSLGKDAASLIMHKRNHWQVEMDFTGCLMWNSGKMTVKRK